ncbi:MAG: MazG-like family protein [Clostridium perfringens]|nr:NTP pyrophosphohydrolase [Staphylococcus phage Quidividi]MDU7109334.1 MazG-like family protein [Clostridium perfringens]
MDKLVKLVEEWSKNKGLDKSDSFRQLAKVLEEVGEVASALARADKELLEDGIGDTIVTLIILAQQQGLKIEDCLATAYGEIKGRTGEMKDGIFVKSEDLK